jgi:carbon monoxide dehydrogenase subunit G
MELSGAQSFSAAPQAVWDALHNPATLQNAAGVSNVEWTDSAVTATITVPSIAGPFAGTRTVQGQVSENTPPRHMKVSLNRGPVNAAATIDLAAEGAGTKLTYAITAIVSGPMGPMAEMSKPLIEGQVNQFFAKLAQSI